MKISNHIFLASLLIALINACKKQNIDPLSQLPPITQTGANTFGCLVNGLPIVADNPGYLFLTFDTNINGTLSGPDVNNNTRFSLEGSHKNNDGSLIDIGFSIDSMNYVIGKTYTFILNNGKNSGSGKGVYTKIGTSNIPGENGIVNYGTNEAVKGSVTLKIVSNTIIAGTFNFNAVNAKGDTVKITNGRFDWPHQ